MFRFTLQYYCLWCLKDPEVLNGLFSNIVIVLHKISLKPLTAAEWRSLIVTIVGW